MGHYKELEDSQVERGLEEEAFEECKTSASDGVKAVVERIGIEKFRKIMRNQAADFGICREELGWSMKETAEKLGLTTSAYRCFEETGWLPLEALPEDFPKRSNDLLVEVMLKAFYEEGMEEPSEGGNEDVEPYEVFF